MQLRISLEGTAADSCEEQIKTLSTSLGRAEKNLEAVIATTKKALAAAHQAGQKAPSAADVVSTRVPVYYVITV